MLLIHLSDIHFRKDEVGIAMDPNVHLRNELLIDAEAMCDSLGSAPDAILISGDLTFAGEPEEYDFALLWLEEFCTKCGTDLKSIFIVPGNHDVVRKVASSKLIQSLHQSIKKSDNIVLDATISGLLKDPEASRLLYDSLSNYNDFAGNFFCSLLPPDRTIAKRDLTLNDGSTLRLSGLNSTFVSSEADKPGELFVDPASYGIIRERGVENIVLCHHPYNWLRVGDALRDHLHDVARIHLFGHDHTNRIEMGRDWIQVAASAAHPDRTESGWEPGYNLMELTVLTEGTNRKLDVHTHVRVWQQRPGEFRAKMDNGNNVFHQTIDIDAWTMSPPVDINPDSFSEPSADSVEKNQSTETSRIDPMDTLRDISVRFFKLSLSEKSAIAGKLNLLEEEDMNKPDFERFRQVLIRARDREQIEELDREVKAVEGK